MQSKPGKDRLAIAAVEKSVLLSQQLMEQIDRKISKGVDIGGNVSNY